MRGAGQVTGPKGKAPLTIAPTPAQTGMRLSLKGTPRVVGSAPFAPCPAFPVTKGGRASV
jgi:hypothetical protein